MSVCDCDIDTRLALKTKKVFSGKCQRKNLCFFRTLATSVAPNLQFIETIDTILGLQVIKVSVTNFLI